MPTRFENEALGIGDTPIIQSVNNNSACVATLAAPGAGRKWVVTGGTISLSAAPSAAVTVTATAGVRTVWQCEVPAAVVAPIAIPRLDSRANEAVVVTIPAVGGTTRATVSLLAVATNAQ